MRRRRERTSTQLCLGITNIWAAHIPVVGTLSRPPPPSVTMVMAPVHPKQLLAEIFWIHLRTLQIIFFKFVCSGKYWRNCRFPSSESTSVSNCSSFFFQTHHLFSASALFSCRATCDDFRGCLGWGNWFNVFENVLSLGKISDAGAKSPACVKPRTVNAEGRRIQSDVFYSSSGKHTTRPTYMNSKDFCCLTSKLQSLTSFIGPWQGETLSA